VASTSAPNAPSGLTATVVSSSEIDLAWTDNSSNQTGFQIQRSLDNTTWTNLVTVGATTTTYNDTGLAAGTLYYYRVAAYNGTGASNWSNTASATTATSGSGTSYYIAPNPGSGAGTLASPYGLADLQTNAGGYYVPGPAITNRVPGDTLYFRAGIYNIQGAAIGSGYLTWMLLTPA
jgi:hypothetical protein